MSNRSASAYSRSSRFAAPVSSSTREPFGIVDAVRGHVVGEHAALVLRRRPVAQRLLDRAGDRAPGRRASCCHSPGLRWNSTDRVGEQLRERLGAGRADQRREADHLAVGEPRGRAVVGVDLGFAQLGDEAVVGMRTLVGEERCPVLAGLAHRLDRVVGDVRRFLEAVERRVHPVPERVAVGGGNAEQLHDHVHRAGSPRTPRRSRRRPARASGSRQSIAVARTNGSSSVIARGVNARLTSLRCTSCSGGSMKIIMGSIACVSSALDRRALGRAVEQRLLRRVEHVGVARQRVETELVVAVAGLVVAQPAVDRVRIVVELVRERVQLHAAIVSREDAVRVKPGRSWTSTVARAARADASGARRAATRAAPTSPLTDDGPGRGGRARAGAGRPARSRSCS